MSGKAKLRPLPAKRGRGKEKDEYDWRADPKDSHELSGGQGGFKSIKHRWLTMYLDKGIPSDARPTGKDSSGAEAVQEAHVGRLESDAGASAPTPVAAIAQDDDRAAGVLHDEAAAAARQQAEAEVKEQAEKRARTKTENGLRKDDVEAAAKKAERQAEAELLMAAETDRAAHVASGLRKEAGLEGGAQASHRSSENAADTSADMLQRLPALSTSDNYPAGTAKPARHASALSAPAGDRGGSGAATVGSGRVNATGGGRAEASSPAPPRVSGDGGGAEGARHSGGQRETSAQAREVATRLANGSAARGAPPLMRVSFLDGDGHEHLGELDLNQLDSFRDLWLTIRSAYSARLPKGELKLIYRDVDDDLMQYEDEPWEHFKGMARSIFLARHEGAQGA